MRISFASEIAEDTEDFPLDELLEVLNALKEFDFAWVNLFTYPESGEYWFYINEDANGQPVVDNETPYLWNKETKKFEKSIECKVCRSYRLQSQPCGDCGTK